MITDKELAELFKTVVIPAYQKCIKEIEGKGISYALEICMDSNTLFGVCFFLKKNQYNCYRHTLIERYGITWGKYPHSVYTTEQIISLHEKRISIMQDIINKVES